MKTLGDQRSHLKSIDIILAGFDTQFEKPIVGINQKVVWVADRYVALIFMSSL